LATDLVQHKVEVIVVTGKEAIPRLGRVAVLWNPDTPFHTQVVQDLKAVAPLLAIELSVVGVQRPEGFTPAFSAVRRARAQALYVIEDTPFFTHRAMLVKVASEARLQ
jgi:putative ABC transport system substrate-binding protein